MKFALGTIASFALLITSTSAWTVDFFEDKKCNTDLKSTEGTGDYCAEVPGLGPDSIMVTFAEGGHAGLYSDKECQNDDGIDLESGECNETSDKYRYYGIHPPA